MLSKLPFGVLKTSSSIAAAFVMTKFIRTLDHFVEHLGGTYEKEQSVTKVFRIWSLLKLQLSLSLCSINLPSVSVKLCCCAS
jgi:hypothetical protein